SRRSVQLLRLRPCSPLLRWMYVVAIGVARPSGASWPEARRALQPFAQARPDPGHLLEVGKGPEAPVRVAVRDDPLGDGRADAGERLQLFCARPVQVDPTSPPGSS